METVAKIKGTSVGSFTVGLKGVTLYQGSSYTGISPNPGDVFIQTGDTPNLFQYNGSTWIELTAKPSWVTINSNLSLPDTNTVSSNTNYFVDTSSGSITVTLPSSPAVGDKIIFVDSSGSFATNNLVIELNGNDFQSTSGSISATSAWITVELIFTANSVWTSLDGNAGLTL
jgi:hypothetical protein